MAATTKGIGCVMARGATPFGFLAELNGVEGGRLQQASVHVDGSNSLYASALFDNFDAGKGRSMERSESRIVQTTASQAMPT